MRVALRWLIVIRWEQDRKALDCGIRGRFGGRALDLADGGSVAWR